MKKLLTVLILALMLTTYTATVIASDDKDTTEGVEVEEKAEIELNDINENIIKLIIDSFNKNKVNTAMSPIILDNMVSALEEISYGTTYDNIKNFLNRDIYTTRDTIKRKLDNVNMINKIKQGNNEIPINITTSIWQSDNIPVKYNSVDSLNDYLNTKFYRIKAIDRKTTSEKINKFLGNTENPIDMSVDKALVIGKSGINLRWKDSFWEEPVMGTFSTRVDGKSAKIEVPMMFGYADKYISTDRLYGYQKEFNEGLTFTSVIPKANDITVNDLLEGIKNASDRYEVTVNQPRFKIDNQYKFKELLEARKVTEIFTKNADLYRLSDDRYPIDELLLFDSIELNQLGTVNPDILVENKDIYNKPIQEDEELLENAEIPEQKEVKEVFIDRPFIFLITDDNTGDIIYFGIVNDVTPEVEDSEADM